MPTLVQLPLTELLLLVGVATVATGLARRALPTRWRRSGLVLIPLAVFGLGALYWSQVSPNRDILAETYLPSRSDDRGYASSQTCRSCHPGTYASWHKTYHRTMTQVATPSTIVAGARTDFEKRRRFESHGQSARISRRENEFWIDMVHPEWDKARAAGIAEAIAVTDPKQVERRVILTTGSHHFQVFWFTSERTGELWQFPWRYHIGESRWVHRNDVFLQPADKSELSHFRTWNHQCIHCHNVGGEPGMGPAPRNFFSNTRVGEIGIACESCHGPAEAHVRKYRNPGRRLKQRVAGTTAGDIINPARTSPSQSSQICGQCHSHMANHDGDQDGARQFLKTGLHYRPGDDLHAFGKLLTLKDGHRGNEFRFWADGNCRSGGREYNGLLGSPCHQPPGVGENQSRQMSCLSCHSMHNAPANDQLKPIATRNPACTQCHPRFKDTATLKAHTHHQANSTGSQCYNCHMPHTSYALFKAIRSHQIDSPRVTPTGPNTRPNACNLCHLDRTLTWTSDHLADWYGQPRVELTGADRDISAAVHWALAGDAGQRVIAAWHFGWEPAQTASGTPWIAPALAQTLKDPYPAIRWVGWQSLKSLPGMPEFDYDFDGPDAHRRNVVEQLTRGRRHDPMPTNDRPARPEIFIRSGGHSDWKSMERLIRARDNRRVEIYE